MAHGLNPTHEPFLLIKFYWQTATAIDVLSVAAFALQQQS